jgi:parallel beta-helix repeat protein
MMKKALLPLLLFILPLLCFGDDTAAIQSFIDGGGGTYPAGTYSITQVRITNSVNFTGSTITGTGTGAMFVMNTAGKTLQGGTYVGLTNVVSSGGSYCISMAAANTTVQFCTIHTFPAYAIVGGNFSGQTITNNTISDIGYLGVSLVASSNTVTGLTVTNNTINRTLQGVSVPQAALIVRAVSPGVMSGATINGNTITMPVNPTSTAGECFEIRNVTGSTIKGNTFTNGTIGLSIVQGCTRTFTNHNTFSGQSLESVELGDSPQCSLDTTTITSGHIGFLFDGTTANLADTIQKANISGLTGTNPYPIEVNIHTSTPINDVFNNVTLSTTTQALYLHYANGFTMNNWNATGNNTTQAIFEDTAIGNLTINTCVFSGFTPKLIGAYSLTTIVVNNIVGTGVTPTGTFLGVSVLSSFVTLGSNIVFNPGSTVPVISYTPSTVILYVGVAAALTPVNTGGPATSWALTGTLPLGLSFSTSTGIISGTPTTVTASRSFTITATNTAGSGTAPLTIIVNALPPVISYTPSVVTFTQGSPITPMTPNNTGGVVVSYAISPAIGAGLSFNTSTGVISGTPSSTLVTTSYSITATNSGGSGSTSVSITVNPPAPNISYSSPQTYLVGTPISNLTPTNSGGSSSTWTVSPALPLGLLLNTSNGVISGTPTAVTATTVYTVTATNISGVSHFNLTITVNLPPPPVISYSPNSYSFPVNAPISNIVPSNTGGSAVSWSISPVQPLGLFFSTTTGVISGTPSVVQGSTTYTVSATNLGGTATTTISFTITTNTVIIRVHGKASKI